MKDVLGEAIFNYHHYSSKEKLWIHNKYGRKEEMPLSVYFRSQKEMPLMELKALAECRGKVLDIGAGAGAHALVLQQKAIDVTALDISPRAVAVMQQRGVLQAVCANIFFHGNASYDTLLLLMNGIGLVGNIAGLRQFLNHAKSILKPGGQLLFDSSDVAYLYKGKIPVMERYYGEILFQYEYKKQRTDWFTWLYIDRQKLSKIANEEGWKLEILMQDEFDQYLARLTVHE